ncbi:hypothetical protein ABVT39_013935 [Epinephelus coioides]
MATELGEDKREIEELRNDLEASSSASGRSRSSQQTRGVYGTIQIQEEGLSEKTLALERSQITEKFSRSSLKNERECFEQMVLEKQSAKAQDDYCRLQEQQLAESNFQLRHVWDTELRLNQQETALDESTKAY